MRHDPRAAHYVELLLKTRPLVKAARREEREDLQLTWMAAATGVARETLDITDDRLPQTPRAAVLALLCAVLELAEAHQVSRMDLVDYFNDRAERGEIGTAQGIDDAIARLRALLCLLAARRMAQPDNNEGRAA